MFDWLKARRKSLPNHLRGVGWGWGSEGEGGVRTPPPPQRDAELLSNTLPPLPPCNTPHSEFTALPHVKRPWACFWVISEAPPPPRASSGPTNSVEGSGSEALLVCPRHGEGISQLLRVEVGGRITVEGCSDALAALKGPQMVRLPCPH